MVRTEAVGEASYCDDEADGDVVATGVRHDFFCCVIETLKDMLTGRVGKYCDLAFVS